MCTHAVSCGPQPRNDPHVRLIVVWSAALQISDSAAMALSLDDLPDDMETLKAWSWPSAPRPKLRKLRPKLR